MNFPYMFAMVQSGVGIIGDNQIHLSHFQKIYTFGGSLVCYFNVYIGMCLMKFIQERHQIITADGVTGTDTELSASQITGLHNLIFPPFDQIHGRFNMPKQSFAFRSELHSFGASDKECLSETDCGALDSMAVRSSYPEAKRLAETLCVAYYREYGVPVRIARLTQTFGTGVVRGDSRVFAQFAEAALTGRDIVLHTPGTTARCYCAVSDAVRALDVILHQGTDGEAYNVANPSTYCTIREMADRIAMRYPGVHVVSDLAAAEGRG